MRFLASFILHFSFLIAATAAPEGEARFERRFADAAKAYDENRLPDAIQGWEALVAEGQKQPETKGILEPRLAKRIPRSRTGRTRRR